MPATIITDFILPITSVRTYVKDQMSLAWGITGAQALARTIYPDSKPEQEALNSIDGAGSPDGLTEIYAVITPGLTSRIEGNYCQGEYAFPVKIYILRKVNDTPHNDAAAMLTRAGQLVSKLIPQGFDYWTGVTGMMNASLEQMTADFPGFEEYNTAHFAAVYIEITLRLQVAGA